MPRGLDRRRSEDLLEDRKHCGLANAARPGTLDQVPPERSRPAREFVGFNACSSWALCGLRDDVAMVLPDTEGYDRPTIEPLLEVAEVLRVLRCSRPTLYRLIREGELAPTYVRSRPRFHPQDVRGYLRRSRRTRPAS